MIGLSKKLLTGCLLAVFLINLTQCGSANKGLENPDSLFEEAMRFFEKKKYVKALEIFEKIKFDFPGSDNIAVVQYHTGLCNYHMKHWQEAENEFQIINRDFNAFNYSEDNQFYLAMATFHQVLIPELDPYQTQSSIEEFEVFLTNFPNSTKLKEAEEKLFELKEMLAKKDYLNGRLYRRMGNYASAVIYFKDFEKEFPQSKLLPLVKYETALCFFNQNELKKATHLCDSLANLDFGKKLNSRILKLKKNIQKKKSKS